MLYQFLYYIYGAIYLLPLHWLDLQYIWSHYSIWLNRNTYDQHPSTVPCACNFVTLKHGFQTGFDEGNEMWIQACCIVLFLTFQTSSTPEKKSQKRTVIIAVTCVAVAILVLICVLVSIYMFTEAEKEITKASHIICHNKMFAFCRNMI